MDYQERIGWLLFGMAIGFVAGYIVRALRELKEDVHELKEELDEVDDIVKHQFRGDDGFMSNRLVADIMMIVVLAMVLISTLVSIRASRTVEANADCSRDIFEKTIVALNERTTYAGAQADSNVELQRDQADFFSLLLKRPPETEARRSEAAQEYLASLEEFVELSEKTSSKIDNYPYPTNEELQACLS